LYETDDRVVDNTPELGGDVFRDPLLFFFLDRTDALGFYEDLVNDGNRPQYPPRCSVILRFTDEYFLTRLYDLVVLDVGFLHKLR
jgi:hypothetical protein